MKSLRYYSATIAAFTLVTPLDFTVRPVQALRGTPAKAGDNNSVCDGNCNYCDSKSSVIDE